MPLGCLLGCDQQGLQIAVGENSTDRARLTNGASFQLVGQRVRFPHSHLPSVHQPWAYNHAPVGTDPEISWSASALHLPSKDLVATILSVDCQIIPIKNTLRSIHTFNERYVVYQP